MNQTLRFFILCIAISFSVHAVSGQMFKIESVETTPVKCFGLPEGGSLTITTSGGVPPYRYVIIGDIVLEQITDLTSYTFSDIPAGNYSALARDGNMTALVENDVIVSSPDRLITAVSPEPAAICMNTGVIIDGNPSGGTIPYTHMWSGPAAGLLSQTNIAAPVFTSGSLGTFNLTYTVEDFNECVATQDISVNVFDHIAADVTHTNVLCHNDLTGSITVYNVSGGSGSFEYRVTGREWQANNVFEGLAAGDYAVSIRDALYRDYCNISLGTVQITQPPALSGSLIAQTNILCNGGSNGSVTVGASGGTGSYQYSIDGVNFQAGGTFGPPLAAGDYTIVIRDSNGCTFNVPVSLTEPPALSLVVDSQANVSCNGGADGSVTANASGGAGSYQYSLNGIDYQVQPTFSGLSAGNYTITVRDENGCTATSGVTITQPPLLTGSISSQTNVSCNGLADGSVTIAASGGTAPYQYSRNGVDFQAGSTFSNLAAGNYTITIKDSNGCTVAVPVAITQPAALSAAVQSQTSVTCHGGADGSVTVVATGGTTPYGYSIDGAVFQPSATFEGVSAGAYTVTVRDAAGCIFDLPVTITQPASAVDGSIVSKTDVTCKNAGNGIIIVAGSGGTSPYQYSLSGGAFQSEGTFDNLNPGSYTVTVRDENGCTFVLPGSQTISEPESLTAGVLKINVTGCHGSLNGSIEIVDVFGSWAEVTGNYEYTIDGWSSSSTDPYFGALGAGTYNVQVRDADNPGCFHIINENLEITQPAPITADLLVAEVSCFGGNDGSIRFRNVEGGSGTYQYSIYGPGTTWQTSPNFYNLPAGTYDVRIRNNNVPYCPAIINPALVIGQPGELQANVLSVDVTGCHGNNNGEITISGASGGSGNYRYSIDNGSSWTDNNEFRDLVKGTYQVWIGDSDVPSCTMFLRTVEIDEPDVLYAEFEVSGATCFGVFDGSIEITVSTGGSGNFEFSINGTDWQTGVLFGGLAAGEYTILVRDRDFPGCTVTVPDKAIISQPPVLSLDIVDIVYNNCHGEEGGIITVLAAGGTPQYGYSLYNGLALVETLEPVHPEPAVFQLLPAGTNYRVEVNDLMGCGPVVIDDIVVAEPDELVINSVVSVDNNCHGGSAGTITIDASGGTGLIEYSINGVDFLNNGGLFTGLVAGTYEIAVKDDNNCLTAWGQVEITQPGLLSADLLKFDVTCNGLDDGRIEIAGQLGGMSGNYEYSRDNNTWTTDAVFTGLGPGVYHIWMRDQDAPDCKVELSGSPVEIAEPDVLEFVTVIGHIDCFGNLSGSIGISATGGNGRYEYRLDGGAWQAESLFDGLAAGSYLVQVRDSLGCSDNETVTLTEPDLLIIDNIISNDESCFELNDGNIDIDVILGGNGPFSYSIDGGETFQDDEFFDNLSPGSYLIGVLDANGCQAFFPATIDILAANEIVVDNVTIDHISCNGAGDGSITITASGGAGGIQYSFEGAGFSAINIFPVSAGGEYSIRVSDIRGCIIEDSYSVGEPDLLVLAASHENVICFGEENGVVNASGTGGVSPYIFKLFLDGVEEETKISDDQVQFTGLTPGNYHVELTDANGCAAGISDVMTVLDAEQLVIASVTSENVNCYGAGNGEITVAAAGGTGTLVYSINSGVDFLENDGIFTGLAPGTYNAVVRDANGCETVYPDDIIITQPPEIQIAVVEIINVSCYNNSDGSIEVAGSGGTGVLEYSLDGVNYQSDGLFANLPAREYTLYVRDEINCVVEFNLPVSEPAEMVVTAHVLNTSCHGVHGDPEIRARVTGGTAPYTITLYLSGEVVDVFNDVPENEWVYFESLLGDTTGYQVVADDCRNCGPVASELLSTYLPDVFEMGAFSHTDLTCFGIPDGTISVSVQGGSIPYTYTLYDDSGNVVDQMESNEDGLFSALYAGTYVVEIDDVNGCGPLTTGNIIIEQPEEIEFIVFREFLNCQGDNSGLISIIASGGNGELSYSIDGGINFFPDGSFSGLAAGTYELVVKDIANCMFVLDTIVLTEPELLELTSVVTEDIIIGSGNEYGSVTIGVAGGVAPYSYSIDAGTTWQSENYFGALEMGEYEITVMDSNGCFISTTVEILEIIGLSAEITLMNPVCHGGNDGIIVIIGQLGVEPYEYSISGGVNFSTSESFTGLGAGTYYVVVRDARGYEYSEAVELTEPDDLGISYSVTDVWCRDLTRDGAINIDVSGGTGNYSFLWSNDSITMNIDSLTAGKYSVLIEDGNGCTLTRTFEVKNINWVDVDLAEEHFYCPGESVYLIPSVNGEGDFVKYSWLASSGPDPDSIPFPLVSPSAETYYSLRVIIAEGCYADTETRVVSHPVEGLYIGNDTVIFQGSSIKLEAKGGYFVRYEWGPGAFLSKVSGPETIASPNSETRFYVMAETAQGCFEYDSILIGIAQPVFPVSGFTPNSDGINDFFDIPNASDYPNIEVEVYTRTGQRIYYSKGYSDDRRWNGTLNGKPLPMGTYYFVITLNDAFGTKPITGPVTIVR
jgi:large repetitive protein